MLSYPFPSPKQSSDHRHTIPYHNRNLDAWVLAPVLGGAWCLLGKRREGWEPALLGSQHSAGIWSLLGSNWGRAGERRGQWSGCWMDEQARVCTFICVCMCICTCISMYLGVPTCPWVLVHVGPCAGRCICMCSHLAMCL